MEGITTTAMAEKLRSLTSGLKEAEQALKAEPNPEALPLREFRIALDDARLTAWAVSELVNAHQARDNPHKILSFLAAQRVRRFTEMAENLCRDLEAGEVIGATNGIEELGEAIRELQRRLPPPLE